MFRAIKENSIKQRAEIKKNRLVPYLNKEESLLDIGCGNGGLVKLLINEGFTVKTTDVKDKSFYTDIKPIIYDGSLLPFEDDSFDTVLIITVLHHIKDNLQTLMEAKRVSRKKIIVMEDIYTNSAQKYLTYISDSINNNEYWTHPHTNRNDAEWRSVFNELDLRLTDSVYYRFLAFFKQVTYVLKI